MNARLRNPARVRARRRSLARRVEVNPETTLACSRSITRIVSSESSSRKSRSWSTNVVCLVPAMKYLPSFLSLVKADTAANFPFNLCAALGPPCAAPSQQILVIGLGWFKCRHHNTAVVVMAGLDYKVSGWQVLEDLRQVFSAIQRGGHLVGITCGKLEENVRSNRHNGRPHARRVLIQKLIRGADADTELARFGKEGVGAAIESNQILDLIAIQGEELSTMAREQRILYFGQKQAS